ncbi:MAG: class I SAM-dependent rRNA methyltransferase [Methylacidiphilaceae bacterium]|nr:class I SAM-dependent rRNA methyltransferase [Candidatus Methylacidiphilaceae bacterium]
MLPEAHHPGAESRRIVSAGPLPAPPPLSPGLSGRALLQQQGTHRCLHGHPWIYRSELAQIEGDLQDGDCVEARSARGDRIGCGIWSSRSQIAIRLYSRREELLDSPLLSRLLDEAFAYRNALGLLKPQDADAARLVWSESDGLPGLIVDRYQDWLVVQLLTAGMERRSQEILSLIQEKTGLSRVVLRNDAPVRLQENLPLEKKILSGSYSDPLWILENGVALPARLIEGQKTGLYLDQSANYREVSSLASGRRVLDLFCYQGAFSLFCSAAGALSCTAVDQSAAALRSGRAAAERTGAAIEWVEENVFDWLRKAQQAKAQYDLIILDPPSFTKTKAQHAAALRGYHELHLRALRLLAPGGRLVSFCCSHHFGLGEWKELIGRASWEANVTLRLRKTLGQSLDHPILPTIPETEYLKGCLVERV